MNKNELNQFISDHEESFCNCLLSEIGIKTFDNIKLRKIYCTVYYDYGFCKYHITTNKIIDWCKNELEELME